jgi:hypothetical protein
MRKGQEREWKHRIHTPQPTQEWNRKSKPTRKKRASREENAYWSTGVLEYWREERTGKEIDHGGTNNERRTREKKREKREKKRDSTDGEERRGEKRREEKRNKRAGKGLNRKEGRGRRRVVECARVVNGNGNGM